MVHFRAAKETSKQSSSSPIDTLNDSFHSKTNRKVRLDYRLENVEEKEHILNKQFSETECIKDQRSRHYQYFTENDSLDDCDQYLSRRQESEREISEITHDNTLYNSFSNSLTCDNNCDRGELGEKSILIKEITETVEIDKINDFKKINDEGHTNLFDRLNHGNCENTRVTIVKDVRANFSSLDKGCVDNEPITDMSSNKDNIPNNKDVPQTRVDLETLYIVECASKQHSSARDKNVPVPIFFQNSDQASKVPCRLDMNKLYTLNDMLTREDTVIENNEKGYSIFENEITSKYELHEYSNNSMCLLMHVGELDKELKQRIENAQTVRLSTKIHDRCRQHIDVLIGAGLSFILPENLPINYEITDKDESVSVNYIDCETRQLLGCERRTMVSLSDPIKAAMREEKTKIGDNRYLSVLIVSTNCKNRHDKFGLSDQSGRNSLSSHHIVEKYIPLLNDLRRDAYYISDLYKDHQQDYKVKRERQFHDVAIQVKPSVCDEAISFTSSSVLSKSVSPVTRLQKHRDATTSPLLFNDEEDDEYAADIFCTNLDLTTKRKHIPGLGKPLINSESHTTSRNRSTKIKQLNDDRLLKIRQANKINAEALPIERNATERAINIENRRSLGSKIFSGTIPINRIKAKRPPRMDIEYTIPGLISKRPIIVQNKNVLIKETLNTLRKSIRQHARDTYRVQLDNRQRSNSWSCNYNETSNDNTRLQMNRRQLSNSCKHEERHVRAKLIPVLNNRASREYFARIDDYINENAAKCIKRSYSTSYMHHAPRSRIRWVRIPGETIRIEEQRIIDVDNMMNPTKVESRQLTNAECRELPYELRYWNILHLLNKERQSGKQLGRVFPLPLEDWVLTNNFRSGIRQTAQEILSAKYCIKSPEDNALLSFLTYDNKAEEINRKYIDALMKHGRIARAYSASAPRPNSTGGYRRVERRVRYHKLPDRFVPISNEQITTQPITYQQWDNYYRMSQATKSSKHIPSKQNGHYHSNTTENDQICYKPENTSIADRNLSEYYHYFIRQQEQKHYRTDGPTVVHPHHMYMQFNLPRNQMC